MTRHKENLLPTLTFLSRPLHDDDFLTLFTSLFVGSCVK